MSVDNIIIYFCIFLTDKWDKAGTDDQDGMGSFDVSHQDTTNRSSSGELGRNGRPTMMDIARIAGVSQSSVSLVLNQMSGARISTETRERVRQVAREIGYALPAERRKESTGLEPDKIALIFDEISTSPHPVISLDGVRDFAFEQGMIVAGYTTRSNQSLKDATLKSILDDKSVAGVIYATIFTRKVILPSELENIPTVLLNCYGEERKYVSIVPGEVSGSFTATAHLTGLGHKRIGFVNGEPWMDASIDRLKGYKQALSTFDIAFDETLVRDGDWMPLRGYKAALELLSLDQPPTAIFCGNDLMAIGALEAASERGLRVPYDISIMGYDDQELARHTRPLLSTLELPSYEMGLRATEFLIDMAVHKKAIRPMTIKIDGPLVVRESTAPPKRA